MSDHKKVLPKSTKDIWWRVFIFFLIVFLMIFSFRISRIGFNPTDDGLILAQAKRLLMGETPHLDFLSPRPVGSPLLHTFELFLPLPLLFVSRVIVVAEMLLIALLAVDLITKSTNFSENPYLRKLLVMSVFLLNLHTFPLMPWHTIDGILFCLLATWLLTSAFQQNQKIAVIGSGLLIGFVPLIKQSFAPMIGVGVLLILMHRSNLKVRLIAVMAMGLPCFSYFGWIIKEGGMRSAIDQMTGGSVPSFSIVFQNQSLATKIIVFFGILFLVISLVSNLFYVKKKNRYWHLMKNVLSVALFLNCLQIVVNGKLGLNNWSVPLLPLASVGVMITFSSAQQVPIGQFIVTLIAFMITLSWGYPNSNLLAGALFLIASFPLIQGIISLFRTHRFDFKTLNKMLVAPTLAISMTVTTATMLRYVEVVREKTVYRDVPFKLQTDSLAGIDQDLAGIRSNHRIYQYLSDVKECIAKYDSKNLAVLPDGAIVPLIFNRRNPLRIDWSTPFELVVEPFPYFLPINCLRVT